ncbi:hypothetical protein ACFE04_016493 [Oxalis oulophora]
MACWSAENATNAFLRAMNMRERNYKEPDVVEFTSALAAGNNSQHMVMASSTIVDVSTLLALLAAATQNGGRVFCILSSLDHLQPSKLALGVVYANQVEFLVGDATKILLNECKGADFVVIDCNIDDYKQVFGAAQECLNCTKGGVIVGYNIALHKGWGTKFNTHFLPIGEGLLVTRIHVKTMLKRSRWIVKVDKCTGEEHVFRVILPQEIEA